MDHNITELEHTVQLLDEYTRRLGTHLVLRIHFSLTNVIEEKFKRLAVQKKESKKTKA